MNIEEIKKRVENFKEEWAGATGIFDREDFSDDILYLLTIIESVEQDLSIIANSENVNAMNTIAEEALKAIRGN